jgi:hypothetical protein
LLGLVAAGPATRRLLSISATPLADSERCATFVCFPHTPLSKGWHPGSFRNTEKVWKKEQQAAEEQRKLEELQKQLEEERRANEYVEIAAAAGHKRWGGPARFMV